MTTNAAKRGIVDKFGREVVLRAVDTPNGRAVPVADSELAAKLDLLIRLLTGQSPQGPGDGQPAAPARRPHDVVTREVPVWSYDAGMPGVTPPRQDTSKFEVQVVEYLADGFDKLIDAARSWKMPTIWSQGRDEVRVHNLNQEPINPATEDTLAALLTELTRTRHVASAELAVAGTSGFVTVVEVTPSTTAHVTGFNADVQGLTDIRYRYRLATGADGSETVLAQEQVTSGANSWISIDVDVVAGTRLVVQVDHSEVGDVACRASVAYRE